MTPVPVQTGIELPYFYRPSSELVIGLALLRPGMKSEDCNIDAESCNLCITDVQRNQRVFGNGNFFALSLDIQISILPGYCIWYSCDIKFWVEKIWKHERLWVCEDFMIQNVRSQPSKYRIKCMLSRHECEEWRPHIHYTHHYWDIPELQKDKKSTTYQEIEVTYRPER